LADPVLAAPAEDLYPHLTGGAVGNLTNVVYPVSPAIVLADDPLNRLSWEARW
jgi:hypothetical protein